MFLTSKDTIYIWLIDLLNICGICENGDLQHRGEKEDVFEKLDAF